jgi:hypothetical protein
VLEITNHTNYHIYMTANDDLTNQHDIVPPHRENPETPEDMDDKILEGDELAGDLDGVHESAFGNEDNESIAKEINKDEIARVKGLSEEEQTKKD